MLALELEGNPATRGGNDWCLADAKIWTSARPSSKNNEPGAVSLRRRALLEARWSWTPLTPILKSSRRYHPAAMGLSRTAHLLSSACSCRRTSYPPRIKVRGRLSPEHALVGLRARVATRVNAGVFQHTRCHSARIR